MTPLSRIAEQWSAVDGLLDEALALAPRARDDWLATLSGEAALHRETLRALLATQARLETDDFLHTLPPLRPPAALLAGAEPRAGELVGPYRLIRELGRGGMGLVWLAERHDGLAARHVALKLPRLAWGQGLAERLAREREILAGLEHEHIARLYDAGVDAQGRPFIAMQYVEGEPIDAYCRRHRLPAVARIGLLLQAMAAVAHAHARLVVHRDLKPGNVLVDADGCVTLLDFGLAKLIDGEQAGATAVTEFAGRALTPNYASPEQIRGEPLGTASDVYSLGVLAFELLTEAKPYRLSRGTAAELEEAIMRAEPPRASDAATDPALKKALRGDLDAILARALKKAVAGRYAGVDAFADDLQRHLRGEPVLARPDGAGYRLAKFVGRHRLAVGLGVALTLTVLAGSGVSLWQAHVARLQEQRASAEVRRQRATQDLYIETLSRLSVLAAEEPQALTRPGAVTSVLVDKLNEMAPHLAERPDDRGAQLEAVMVQLNYDQRFAESLTIGEQYLAHLKAHDAPPSQVINTYASLGRTLFQLGRLDDSEAMRRAGLDWAADAHDSETELRRMTIAADLGDLLTNRGRRDEALTVLTRADRLATQHGADQHLRYESLIPLGMYYLSFDDAKALELLQQARFELRANGLADDDTVGQLQWQLGDALLANGRLTEAEEALNESLAGYRRAYGRDSRSAVRAFGRSMAATARLDPARAAQLIAAERQALGQRPGGLPAPSDALLQAREFEAAWLAGNVAASQAIALPDEAMLKSPSVLRNNQVLIVHATQASTQDGRATRMLPLMEALLKHWPDGHIPKRTRLRMEQVIAEAQLAAGAADAARAAAQALADMIDAAQGRHSLGYRAALSVVALAAARAGDSRGAGQALDHLARLEEPPYPSAAERADVELRRAQALALLGRAAEAAAIARAVLPGLQTQHAQSPRLALARRLSAASG
ncbi:serine/threonine-protein kinase [Roseateles cellulosilyticus]|uniref:Serine/threonine protein kinase n=1 Tax=Pelomonas cellulosilytica TaxID=2906762 RepID=A0ABS8Y3R1_9BURK|nr:serine/threonine-protein kinase [Pelomonas sp. P8]MCE4556680.1 serine/threonine protein kinase [Pelomonas sp. P8]